MGHTLTAPATEDEWRAFHDIRRVELFESRGRFGVYDPDHPDDRLPANLPLLLCLDGRPIGTVRLDDLGGGAGVVRLVAITRSEQSRGHGRIMQTMVEAVCRDRGIDTLHVNAAPTAVGYYEKTGWSPYVWDAAELVGIASDCVQMRKPVPAV